MVKKKFNNPFKMFGSYIGAIIGFVLIFTPITNHLSMALFDGAQYSSLNSPAGIYWMISFAIIGFIIGWIINVTLKK